MKRYLLRGRREQELGVLGRVRGNQLLELLLERVERLGVGRRQLLLVQRRLRWNEKRGGERNEYLHHKTLRT